MSRWRFWALLTSFASTSICPRSRLNSPFSASTWFSNCTIPRLGGLVSGWAGFAPVGAFGSCACASTIGKPSGICSLAQD
jgi:hypothetical protein